MPDWLTETLLEMHFHSALVKHFSKIYGAKFFNLYKPSPQKEAWVGFDQGWTKSDLSSKQLFDNLTDAVANNKTSVDRFYLGIFLQFKVVKEFKRKGSRMPAHFDTPYFRSELSLKPNKTTGLSQHETLLRLSSIKNASVSYACGMLFDQSDIYEEPNIDDLRLVDIDTSPSGWVTTENHAICFQVPTDPAPYWCSEPQKGKSYSFQEFQDSERGIRKYTGEELIATIQNATRALGGSSQTEQLSLLGGDWIDMKLVPDCLLIFEYGHSDKEG